MSAVTAPFRDPSHLLVTAMGRLDERRVLTLVEHGLARGQAPQGILDLVRAGLDRVGQRYAAGDYFLADLMMGAEIFREVVRTLDAAAPITPDPHLPPVVFGTVEGDIHEIGKNVAIGYMRYSGMRIVDLGGDVPPGSFVEAVWATKAPVVCLSGLLSTCSGAMRRTVTALGKAGLRNSTAVVIGGHVSESIRRHVGADYWVSDHVQGIEVCRRLLEVRSAV